MCMIPVALVSLEVLDFGREMSYKHDLFSSPLLILNVMMFGSYVPLPRQTLNNRHAAHSVPPWCIFPVAVNLGDQSHCPQGRLIRWIDVNDKNLDLADSGDLVAIAHHVSSLIEYKTCVMRDDLELANEILPSIPKEHHNSDIVALEMATDHAYIFELALHPGNFKEAQSESQWKQLHQFAMSTGMAFFYLDELQIV
ncbi:coatomer subunit beta-2 [Actinidia rufa]|uniref:Coatomer subunit beta-2 n=1 Tax=Actinidia rufa TaxID=165716 RepID=A0A7J0E9N3_9ERIC|nr:coatomer subunit beta-2 [Actinidia rufa]